MPVNQWLGANNKEHNGMKIILKLFLVVLIIWPLYAQSQEPPPPVTQGKVQLGELKSETSAKSNIKTENNGNITRNSISTINKIDTESRNPAAQNGHKPNDEGQTGAVKDDPITRYTLWLVIFTGLLFVCNFLLWLYTMRAANAAKKSADALPTIERAYIFVDACTPEHVEGNMFEVAISFSNFGKTPAILTKVHGEFVWGEQSPSKFPEIKLPFPEGSVVVKPNSSELIKVSAYVPPDILGKIERKEIRSFCCGLVEYHDIWKVKHETGFCWEVSPVGKRGRISDSPLNTYT